MNQSLYSLGLITLDSFWLYFLSVFSLGFIKVIIYPPEFQRNQINFSECNFLRMPFRVIYENKISLLYKPHFILSNPLILLIIVSCLASFFLLIQTLLHGETVESFAVALTLAILFFYHIKIYKFTTTYLKKESENLIWRGFDKLKKLFTTLKKQETNVPSPIVSKIEGIVIQLLQENFESLKNVGRPSYNSGETETIDRPKQLEQLISHAILKFSTNLAQDNQTTISFEEEIAEIHSVINRVKKNGV